MSCHADPLVHTRHLDGDLRAYLDDVGDVFCVFDRQDSGCMSYGVEVEGRRWFVKTAVEARALSYLEDAVRFHSAVQHPRIPALVNTIHTPSSPVLVYEWVDGEVLSSPEFTGPAGRSRPGSPHYRFVRLPLPRIMDVLDAIYQVHVHIERTGYVAVDFYDGCVIYDFERHQAHVCDFDHYRPGPFILESERLPGSSRFMAPEERKRGSLIDHRTNVYTMGAAALVFLARGSREPGDWRGPLALWEVASRAVSADRAARQGCIQEYYDEWRACLARGLTRQ